MAVFTAPIDACELAAIRLEDDERQRCEVWTRVMGYHRPVASFNTGKKGEFEERTYFREHGGARAG
ncbi:hypothetical protein BWI17_21710 [Betaproteobacteria bacterium GR16-43]|nr:hypothetical protein BWI17_21710 [Betaproteobacteria bacterium GR16-43]